MLVSPSKTLNTHLARIGDDIEPIEVPRDDVEIGNNKDGEPLRAEVPRARMIPKNPTRREKQEHNDSGHVTEVGVLLVSKAVELGDNIDLNC